MMKKAILILIVAAICSISYSQAPDTLKLPFYEEDINLPLGISLKECISIIGVEPFDTGTYQPNSASPVYFYYTFDVPLYHKGDTMPSFMYVFFSKIDDKLKFIQLDTPRLITADGYKKLHDFLYSMITDKLGKYTNGDRGATKYTIQNETDNREYFYEIINHQGYFNYYWNIGQLTYRFNASVSKPKKEAIVLIDIREIYPNDISELYK